jgi:hypothetical protein
VEPAAQNNASGYILFNTDEREIVFCCCLLHPALSKIEDCYIAFPKKSRCMARKPVVNLFLHIIPTLVSQSCPWMERSNGDMWFPCSANTNPYEKVFSPFTQCSSQKRSTSIKESKRFEIIRTQERFRDLEIYEWQPKWHISSRSEKSKRTEQSTFFRTGALKARAECPGLAFGRHTVFAV